MASGAMVWGASTAAFKGETKNHGNTWQSEKISLNDNDAEIAMFTARNIGAGYTQTQCIMITSASSKTVTVQPSTETSGDNNFLSALQVTMTRGTKGLSTDRECANTDFTGAGSVTGTLATFEQHQHDLEVILEPGESLAYQITVSLPEDTSNNDLEDKTANANFVWEALATPDQPTAAGAGN